MSNRTRARRMLTVTVAVVALLAGCRDHVGPPADRFATVHVGGHCGGPLAHAQTQDGRPVVCQADPYGVYRWYRPLSR